MLEGSTYLWYPWTLLELNTLRRDSQMASPTRNVAYEMELALVLRLKESIDYMNSTGSIYIMAENLYALANLGNQ
jgi:hypothetical protein